MGFLGKFKFGSTFDDTDDDDEYRGEDNELEEEQPPVKPAAKAPAEQPAPAAREVRTASVGGVNLNGAALELKVVKPERYDVVPQIADHLLNRRTVVLNLESTNKETSRRIIDFLSGVAYSIDGRLSKVAVNTYLVTPANINVSGEALAEAKGEEEAEEDQDPFGDD